VTTPTAEAAGTGQPTATQSTPVARRERAPRRGPADLPFTFPDVGLAKALAGERSEPDWLRDERVEAAKAYESLPLELN